MINFTNKILKMNLYYSFMQCFLKNTTQKQFDLLKDMLACMLVLIIANNFFSNDRHKVKNYKIDQ